MIRIYIDESFPIAIRVFDEGGRHYSDGDVSYEVTNISGSIVKSGNLVESKTEPGFYYSELSFSNLGDYILKIKCPKRFILYEDVLVMDYGYQTNLSRDAGPLVFGVCGPEVYGSDVGASNIKINNLDAYVFVKREFKPKVRVS